jgi:hypothetical protein
MRHNTTKRRLVLLVMFGLMTGLISCQWMQREFGYPKDYDPNSEVEQPRDIPVPEDGEFQSSVSYTHYPAGRKARVARYVYLSDESVGYLDTFYRENMKYGWENSEYDVEGKGSLHFVSSNELCKIEIDELPVTKQRRLNMTSKIVVEIEPIDNGG